MSEQHYPGFWDMMDRRFNGEDQLLQGMTSGEAEDAKILGSLEEIQGFSEPDDDTDVSSEDASDRVALSILLSFMFGVWLGQRGIAHINEGGDVIP